MSLFPVKLNCTPKSPNSRLGIFIGEAYNYNINKGIIAFLGTKVGLSMTNGFNHITIQKDLPPIELDR